MKVYLAGPEVFLPEAREIAVRQKTICRKYGITGHFPLDAEIDHARLSPQEAARAIFLANLAAIDAADALIANMTPIRGPGMDGGTAFEMGYAHARAIPIYAYTNDPRTYLGRARALGLVVRVDEAGKSRDAIGLEIEDFGLVDNLMMGCAASDLAKPIFWRGAQTTGGLDTSLANFEAAVQAAAHAFR
jgi:nucleoside 2-deoxyribosyltransferase